MKTPAFISRITASKAFRLSIAVLSLTGICSLGISAVKGIRELSKQKHEQELSANVSQITRDGVSSIVNTRTGRTLIRNIQVDWIQEGSDSLAVFSKDDLRGYFNIYTGEVVVEPQYKHAWIFSEGLAGVVKDGMVGFINSRGEEVIPCRYPYHGNSLSEFVFKGGHCVVADTSQHIGVIDSLGQWAIEPKYKSISVNKNYALVTEEDGFRKQLTFSGEVILDCVIDYINNLYYDRAYTNLETGEPATTRCQSTEFYEYKVGGRSGLMSASGEFITAPIYSDISALGPRTFRASLPGSWSEVIISATGEVLSRRK